MWCDRRASKLVQQVLQSDQVICKFCRYGPPLPALIASAYTLRF